MLDFVCCLLGRAYPVPNDGRTQRSEIFWSSALMRKEVTKLMIKTETTQRYLLTFVLQSSCCWWKLFVPCAKRLSLELFHLRIQEEARLADFLPPLRRILLYCQSLQQEQVGLPKSGDTERFKFKTSNCTTSDKLRKHLKKVCPPPLVTYMG